MSQRHPSPAGSEDEEHSLALAQTLMDEGRWEEARGLLERLVEQRPTSARAWNKLGVCRVRLGERDGAEQAFRFACEADPGFAAPWSNLGNLYLEQDALDRAEAAYRRALAIDPRFALAHNNLAALLKRAGRYDEAVRHLKEAFRLERDLAGGPGAPRGVAGWFVYLFLAALAFLAWLWRHGARGVAAWTAVGLGVLAATPQARSGSPASQPAAYLAGWVTADQASQPLPAQVERIAASLLNEPVTLRLGRWRTTVRPADLGIRPDLEAMREEAEQRGAAGLAVPVALRLTGPEPSALRRLARRLDAALAVAPTEPKVLIEGAGRGQVLPGRPGLRVDTLALARSLRDASLALRFRTVEIPMKPVAPPPAAGDLESLRLPTLLSSYTTRVEPHQGDRALNVALAAAALNGSVILPGATFSFNRSVGPRITERGYREAPVLVNGRFEVGVGGGVCQVSSTLYNAALLAGLGVPSRAPHSLPVWYVPLARDATVVYDLIDLQLYNPLPYPVAIRALVADDRLTVQVWGPSGSRVPAYRLRTVVEWARKAPTVAVEGPNLEPGARTADAPGNTGYEGSLWRELPLYGPAVGRERINRSFYPMRPGVVRVGPVTVRTESRISEVPATAGMALAPVKQEAHPVT